MSPNISEARVAGGGAQCNFWFSVSVARCRGLAISLAGFPGFRFAPSGAIFRRPLRGLALFTIDACGGFRQHSITPHLSADFLQFSSGSIYTRFRLLRVCRIAEVVQGRLVKTNRRLRSI